MRIDYDEKMLHFLVLTFIALLPPLLLAPVAHADDAAPVEVHIERVSRDGESFFDVHAVAFVRAPPQQAWRVLTDYERLPDFIPDLVVSRVVSRTPGEILLEQQSRSGFLFLTQSVHMLVRVEEAPPATIDVTLVSGDMRRYSGHWELLPLTQGGAEGTRVSFFGTMEPDFYVPTLIAQPIVLANVRRMVESVAAEIERRGAN